ncbi:Plasmodium exported protein (PHISTa), unknown, putative [Plasmodium sp.]|nr:Plasmodium exported protein (PHISTa), unknown, putative [Plasmodium sp.]
MKYHCIKYYSEENHIKNTTKICSVRKIYLNLLSITGTLLVVVINVRETVDAGIFDIYRRNLSELESVEHSGLRSKNENIELKNTLYEKNKNISFASYSEDDVKYNYVRTEGKYNSEEHPPKKYFYNIWNHVLCIIKEGFDDILKDLTLYIEDYLHKYAYHVIIIFWIGIYLYMQKRNTVHIKDGASIKEMKIFIYAFIKYYDTLKCDLFNERKTIFTVRMENTQRLDI